MLALTLFDTFLTQRLSSRLCLAVRISVVISLIFCFPAAFAPGEAPHECDLARLFLSFPWHLFEPISPETKAQHEQVLRWIRARSSALH